MKLEKSEKLSKFETINKPQIQLLEIRWKWKVCPLKLQSIDPDPLPDWRCIHIKNEGDQEF